MFVCLFVFNYYIPLSVATKEKPRNRLYLELLALLSLLGTDAFSDVLELVLIIIESVDISVNCLLKLLKSSGLDFYIVWLLFIKLIINKMMI